jgi:hypothetical protein
LTPHSLELERAELGNTKTGYTWVGTAAPSASAVGTKFAQLAALCKYLF